jgi:trigger factor
MADATAATDETAATEESVYDVKVEDAGPARKRLIITAPAEVIDEKLEESMGTLSTQTSLPGFRKGKAPKALLERRFGSAVRSETKNQVIADAYASAIETHAIKPLGEPDPVEKLDEIELEAGKPLTFSVEVEVVPEFELPDLDNVEIRKPIIEVTEEHIAGELERQQLQLGELEPVRENLQPRDRLVGPGTATKAGDEQPFFRHDSIDIIVPGEAQNGRGHVLGLLIENLADLVAGKKVGDTLTIETAGPESHEMEDIRGKKITIEMTIREAHRIKPAPVEKVLERYGMESEEILREQIRLALEQRRDDEQRSAMREQVYEYLTDAVDFDLPEKVSAAQTTRMLESQRLEMLQRGTMTPEDVEERLAEMRAETEQQSRNRLKLMFVLARLAEHFDVKVSDQEVNGRIAQIAVQRGVRPEQLRAELAQTGGIQQISAQIREHKAADRVIDKATVTEIPLEEWNALVREKSGEAPPKPAATSKKKKKTTSKKKTGKKKTTRKKSSTDKR